MRPTPPDIDTDLIIIGAGVSGINLASKLADTGVKFWLLGSPFESQLAKAGVLENTPLPEGTVGLKFIEEEMENLKAKQISHRSSLCTGIELTEGGYKVLTKFQNFTTKIVVIATGKKQKSLGFDGEADLFHKGISDCTVCDFPLYREKPVAIVGNHEYTIRAAKLMKQHTSPVSLLWYGSGNAPQLDGIDVFENVTNLSARGDEVLEEISFDHSSGSQVLKVRGLFVEGKPVPSLEFLSPLSLNAHEGHVQIDEEFKTSAENVYAMGDITGKTSNYEGALDHANRLFEVLKAKLGIN